MRLLGRHGFFGVVSEASGFMAEWYLGLDRFQLVTDEFDLASDAL